MGTYEVRLVEDKKETYTQIRFSSKDTDIISQFVEAGMQPFKQNSRYTYFRCPGDLINIRVTK